MSSKVTFGSLLLSAVAVLILCPVLVGIGGFAWLDDDQSSKPDCHGWIIDTCGSDHHHHHTPHPSKHPTYRPTLAPSTSAPTATPTLAPSTSAPTAAPSTSAPTAAPTTASPVTPSAPGQVHEQVNAAQVTGIVLISLSMGVCCCVAVAIIFTCIVVCCGRGVGRRKGSAPLLPAVKHVQAYAAERANPLVEPHTCVVCMDEESTHLFSPCGHRCVCNACGTAVMGFSSACPVCRAPATGIQRVWE